MSTVGHSRTSRAFTLIELLVVIAIIAIIAAILFPVFAKVREKARQATVISNMHEIQLGMEEYKLDYHKYPDVLFGYADNNSSMATYTQKTVASPGVSDQPTLYPSFVKDYRTFTDPNNPVSDFTKVTPALSVNVLCPNADAVCTGKASGTIQAGSHTFFQADAYDVSPALQNANTLNTTFVPRYQASWTPISTTASADTANYPRQMRWKSQPGDTYVTCTTYHVPNAGKVIVLFNEGPAKVIDATAFNEGANFWQVRP